MTMPRPPKNSGKASPFARAKWIWPVSHSWDLHNSYALFRHEFVLDQVLRRAPFFITADQSYHLYVNGAFVCRGPARGFQAHWPYDEVDLRAQLRKGRNIIAVRAYNPGFSNFQYLTEGVAGLLAAAAWGKNRIGTSATWKCIRQASVSSDTVPTSLQLFSQEHIDFRDEAGDWTAMDFDDSQWTSPPEAAWNAAPWFQLEPRGIPLLAERKIIPTALLGTKAGRSAKGYQRVRDVVALRFQEDRSHEPGAAAFSPLLISATGKGKFRSYLFDFGKTVVGNLTLTVEDAQGGEIIDTGHTETIDLGTLTPDLQIPTHCRMAFGDRLICRSGKFRHTFFHYYGFRFLCVTVRDALKDFSLGLELNWVGYPLKRTGSFTSSDRDLERIWETCAWTQQCCSLDAYVDTPWREQAQWWGDARVQAWNTFHLDGDTRLFRRGIAQIAAQTTPDGVTYGHAPTMAHSCILPDFTLIWMLTLWDYYWQTCSTEPLLAHHATIQNALAYFRKQTDSRTGLITYDDRFWLFLDWTPVFKHGMPTIYNLWLLLALEKLALLYRAAKKSHEASPLESWARKLRASLARLIRPDGIIRDGIDLEGRIVDETSVHSQTLGIMANLKGLNLKTITDHILLPVIRQPSLSEKTPSAYWITYVFTVLMERGYERDVIAFIKRNWLPMANHGTTWEGFAPERGCISLSHAWSAHPLYHLMQTTGGIRQTGAGWSEITFHPVFHGDSAKCTLPTPHGIIRSEWRKKGREVEVSLNLPQGIKAQVELPGCTPVVLRKKGRSSWVLAGED